MKTMFPWIGGKSYLLPYLNPYPKHNLFVDVFGGSGAVALNYNGTGQVVYNDINSRVVNFYRQLRDNPERLQEMAKVFGILDSRDIFKEYLKPVSNELTDATMFMYVATHCYRGMHDTFHAIDEKYHKAFWNKVQNLMSFWQIVKKWHIECRDYKDAIKRFGVHKNTLLYCDPPYAVGTAYYNRMSGTENLETFQIDDLVQALLKCNAKIILSYDNLEPLQPLLKKGFNYTIINRLNKHGGQAGQIQETKIEYVLRNFKTNRKIDEYFLLSDSENDGICSNCEYSNSDDLEHCYDCSNCSNYKEAQ